MTNIITTTGKVVKKGLEAQQEAKASGRRVISSVAKDDILLDQDLTTLGWDSTSNANLRSRVSINSYGEAQAFQFQFKPNELKEMYGKPQTHIPMGGDEMVDPEAEFLYDSWDWDYQDGRLNQELVLRGRVNEGILELDPLDPEEELFIDWMNLEDGELFDKDIPLALKLDSGRITSETEIPEFVRYPDGSVKPLRSPIGMEGNPRASRLDSQATLDDTPSMVYQLDSGRQNANRTASQVFNRDTGARNMAAESMLDPQADDKTTLFDRNLDSVVKLDPSTQTKYDLETAGWAFDTVKYVASLPDRMAKKYRSFKGKSLYTMGSVDPDSDMKDFPLILWHVGTDLMDDDGLPFSLRNGKELGMHGGSKLQTKNFRQENVLEKSVPKNRANLDNLWSMLEGGVDDPKAFNQELSEVFTRNLVRNQEGAWYEFSIDDNAFDDYVDLIQKRMGVDAEEAGMMAFSLLEYARDAKLQFETGYIVTGKNPLVLRNYSPDFHPSDVAEQLSTMKMFKKPEYEEDLWFAREFGVDEKSSEFVEAKERILSMIEREGFDHVVYNNTIDSQGGVPSIITWRPDTIEIIGNREQGRSLASYGKAFSALLPVVAGTGAAVAPTGEARAEPDRAEWPVRSVRNNNPGNLKEFGDNWKGESERDDPGGSIAEGSFEVFDTPEAGARALATDLTSKYNRGLNTLEKVLSVYAPDGEENDLESYIRSVERQTGLDRNTVFSEGDLLSIMRAITRHEGSPRSLSVFTDEVLQEGLDTRSKRIE